MKSTMRDIKNQEIREQKLKFIEILLIVGGLIGSSLIKGESFEMNTVFGSFLIGALLYYFVVSKRKNSQADYLPFLIAMTIIAPTFSTIAILPLKPLDGMAILVAFSQDTLNIILWPLLTYFNRVKSLY
jgi:uncharacterized membrane protein YfcA